MWWLAIHSHVRSYPDRSSLYTHFFFPVFPLSFQIDSGHQFDDFNINDLVEAWHGHDPRFVNDDGDPWLSAQVRDKDASSGRLTLRFDGDD